MPCRRRRFLAQAPELIRPLMGASGHERRSRPAAKQWYIVHTYSGHENKAKQGLLERAKAMGQGRGSSTRS
jgi:hypothetical protein